MPRIFNIDPRVPTEHSALIPRHAIDEHVRAYTTVQEARSHAKRIIKEAQENAVDIKEHAMREGFQAGWLDSMTVILTALENSNELYVQIESDLKKVVKNTLETSLQQPGLELTLLEGWLESDPRTTNDILIHLPIYAQSQADIVRRRVEETLKITPTVLFGSSENIVIQCGDQVYEFSPTRTMVDLQTLAQNCFQRLEVKKRCAQWSEQIVRHWVAKMNQRCADSALDKMTKNDMVIELVTKLNQPLDQDYHETI